MSGQGTYKYSNGDAYKGTFLEDEFNGFGVFTYANGDKYVLLLPGNLKGSPPQDAISPSPSWVWQTLCVGSI